MNRQLELNVPSPTPPDILAAQTWTNSVVVPIVQNIAGGLGLLIVTVEGVLLAGGKWDKALLIGVAAGGALTGLMLIVRAFRDEVRFIMAAWGERQDRATRAQLVAEIQARDAEITRLHAEGAQATRYTELAAAERLLQDHFQGLAITRQAAMQRMKRREWDIGMGLLRRAGVVSEHGDVRTASYEAGMATVIRAQRGGLGHYVRAADGDFVAAAPPPAPPQDDGQG